MSVFGKLDLLPADPIFGLVAAFRGDQRKEKVNLGIGAYQDDQGRSVVLSSVRKAEKQIIESQLDKSYLPIAGNDAYICSVIALIFGEFAESVCGVQTIGGTGALHLGGALAAKHVTKTIYISDPTWPNHRPLFLNVGLEVRAYPYYQEGVFAFTEFLGALDRMEEGTLVLLQGACHNPTGIDPSPIQWKEIAAKMKEKRLIPFFDVAYLGLGEGIEKDCWPIRYFAGQGHEMVLAFSFAKNMGLYGERVGLLAVLTSEQKTVLSHLQHLIRVNYSNPPLHGARIAATILQDPQLKMDWERELDGMRDRLRGVRAAFQKEVPFIQGIGEQKGMFSLTGLSKEQVKQLREKFAIYMPDNGRMNIAGLNQENLGRVVDAFTRVVQ